MFSFFLCSLRVMGRLFHNLGAVLENALTPKRFLLFSWSIPWGSKDKAGSETRFYVKWTPSWKLMPMLILENNKFGSQIQSFMALLTLKQTSGCVNCNAEGGTEGMSCLPSLCIVSTLFTHIFLQHCSGAGLELLLQSWRAEQNR